MGDLMLTLNAILKETIGLLKSEQESPSRRIGHTEEVLIISDYSLCLPFRTSCLFSHIQIEIIIL